MMDSNDISDLLGTPRRTKSTRMTYQPLEPTKGVEGGIWDLRKKKGKDLGKKCLICDEKLVHRGGRPPMLCGKKKCFRAYRNAYRADYDKARG